MRFALVPGGGKKASRRRRRAAGARPGRGKRSGLVSLRLLARRLEALVRVIEKPEPHARRLARILAADGYAAACVLDRTKLDREGPNLYPDIVEGALALAWAALQGAEPEPETG